MTYGSRRKYLSMLLGATVSRLPAGGNVAFFAVIVENLRLTGHGVLPVDEGPAGDQHRDDQGQALGLAENGSEGGGDPEGPGRSREAGDQGHG